MMTKRMITIWVVISMAASLFCAAPILAYEEETAAPAAVETDRYPSLADPMHISDEDFFGKWDEMEGNWATEPILRYENFEGLADVRDAVKTGDYESARALMLAYYRGKDSQNVLKYDPNTNYDLSAAAMIDKIWTYPDNDKIVGDAKIGTEWNWYSIDLTGNLGSKNGTYWIMDADMDGSAIEIASRENENGYSAFLEIIINGQKRRYPVIADTYISAGENSRRNYGNEPVLYSREAAGDAVTPFGSDTARTYLQFGFDADDSMVITSVKLNFYGRATGDTDKKIYCLTTNNYKHFNEAEFAWNMHYPEAFCFKETGFIWKTVDECSTEWGTEYEWINYSTRMYQCSWLLPRYLATDNEDYAYRALEFTMSQYTQHPGVLYSRPLEGGWRTENLIRTIYSTLESKHMTPEIFTALLKWVYAHGDEIKDINTVGYTNQDSAIKVNFARICAYCPEIAQDGWWEKAKSNLRGFYSYKILNADGSYTESCTNYISGVLDEFVAAMKIILAHDGETDEFYLFMREQLNALQTYYANLAYPSGQLPPWGDGGRGSVSDKIDEVNRYIDDEYMQYIATGGKEGSEPDYTTRLYPSKGICMFKSGWHESDLSALFNNDGGGTHGHYDDLALDVSAYGKYLLVDAGVSNYSDGSVFAANRRKTLYHNTVEIDNKDQIFTTDIYTGVSNPGLMDLTTNGSFDFLVSDSDDRIYPGMDVNRKVLMLKNKYIIVSDYIIPYDDMPHTYRQLWHPDYNFSLQLDPQTKAAYTTYDTSPNIKIVPAETGAEAQLFNRMMYTSAKGETESRSVQYYKENVTGSQTFDTVLYPQDVGEDTYVAVTRIPLADTELSDATAMMITMGNNTGYYYTSHEETPIPRDFDRFSFTGGMAYVETDGNDNVTYLAFTDGATLESDGHALIKSDETLRDFSAKYESTALRLYASEPLPQGLEITSPKSYKAVYLNDKSVDFTYTDGIIVLGSQQGNSGNSGDSAGSGSRPSFGGGSGSGGSSGVGGGVTGTGPDDQSVNPVEPPREAYPFADSEEHWARNYIETLYRRNIVSGVSESSFAPDNSVTRAEFTKILVTACGISPDSGGANTFTDVDPEQWYAPYIGAAYTGGFISGYEDKTFAPDNLITREEMAKLLCIAADKLNVITGVNTDISFADNDRISPWAYYYVKKAYDLGLVTGDSDNCFAPQNNTTRAEAAAVVCRLLGI